MKFQFLRILGGLALAVAIFASHGAPLAGGPATGPEDVPDLTKKEFGEPGERGPNKKPIIESVTWDPPYPTVGQPIGKDVDGKPIFFRLKVRASDPEGRPLKYTFFLSSRVLGPSPLDTVEVNRIGGPGYARVTVVATDEGGLQSDSVTVMIPLLDPENGALNDQTIEFVRKWREEQLRSADIDGYFEGDKRGVPGSQAILDRPSPWRDPDVQRCTRQYLQQVALPIESRLAPGRFTQIDDWGRLLGPAITAVGPVEGNWENPTHFVWAEMNKPHATSRYGISLRDYVLACLEGRQVTLPSPGAPPSVTAPEPAAPVPRETTAPGVTSVPPLPTLPREDETLVREVRELFEQARTALENGNASFRAKNMAQARDDYERALDLFRRALQTDNAGKFSGQSASALALAQRLLDAAKQAQEALIALKDCRFPQARSMLQSMPSDVRGVIEADLLKGEESDRKVRSLYGDGQRLEREGNGLAQNGNQAGAVAAYQQAKAVFERAQTANACTYLTSTINKALEVIGRNIAQPPAATAAAPRPQPVSQADRRILSDAINNYNKRWADRWCSPVSWSGCGLAALNEANGLRASLGAAQNQAQFEWVRTMAICRDDCMMRITPGDAGEAARRVCLQSCSQKYQWPQ